MINKRTLFRVFIEILVCQLILAVLLGLRKSSFFVDEIWTYNLANANYFPAFDNVAGYYYNWVQPDFWRRLIVVDSMNTFDYASVWYNQSQDVLPPFFYAVVHTVSSFFPLQFSKWFVMGPNLVFFVLTQIVVLQLSRKIYGDIWQALLPNIIYGFTLSGINTILYFRMYMMLTFFCTLSAYLHLIWMESMSSKANESCRKYLLGIAIIDICGFLTHYYYLIFASILFFIYSWRLNCLKCYKQIITYFCYSICALLASIAIFPYCLAQIIGIGDTGYRGIKSFSNAFNSAFLSKLSQYNSFLVKDFGGDLLILLLVIVGMMILKSFLMKFLSIDIDKDENGYNKVSVSFFRPLSEYEFPFLVTDGYAAFILVASLAYYLIVVKISVMNDDRYIYAVLPLFALWGSYLINRIVTRISHKKYLAMVMCILTVWLAAVTSFRVDNLKFFDNEVAAITEYVDSRHQDLPLLVISRIPHWHPIIEHIFLIEKAKQSYLTTEYEINKIKKGLTEIEFDGDEILAFVTWDCERPQKEIKDELKQVTGMKNCTPIYRGGDYKRGYMYLLTK